MKKCLIFFAVILSALPIIGQEARPDGYQIDKQHRSFLPGKKTLFGLGALGVVGLTAAYYKGYITSPEINYKTWINHVYQFGKNYPAPFGIVGGICALGGMRIKKWRTISQFMNELKAKIKAREKITLEWLREHLPPLAKEDAELALSIYFKSGNNTMPAEIRRERALRPRFFRVVPPCHYIGICELATWCSEAENEEDKSIIERALHEKLNGLERYLYQNY